jgi:hypothetical protein
MVQKSHEAGLAYVRANLSPEVLNLRTKKKALAAIAAAWGKALADPEYKAEIERINRDWQETYGEPPPHTIEELQRWVARAEIPDNYIPAEKIASSHWTAADIFPFIEGYLLRLRDAKKDKASSAKLSPRELADKYQVACNALRKRLDRWRYEHDAGYVEVSNARNNEPKYLYDEVAVLSVIDTLKSKKKRPANDQQKKN